MQHTNVPTRTRLAVAALAVVLVASGCGTETLDTSGLAAASAEGSRGSTTTTVEPSATVEPSVVEPSTTEPIKPTTTIAPTAPTAPIAPIAPTEPAEPADVPEAAESIAPCGDLAPIPPVPDSMPTKMFDTDGDGTADDAVTAYGAADGWRIRVVQNDVASETLVDQIAGWAYLAEPIPTDHGDRIVLVDNDTDELWEFVTNATGCVQPYVAPPHVGIDDLVVVPVDPPHPAIDDLVIPDDVLMCGPLPDLPDDALIGSDDWFDLDGGGVAGDRIVAYFDGTWKLRAEFSFGAESEIEVPGAGVHGVRVLGLADVDLTYGGEEIIAVVGGGASTVEIGVFSFYEGGCIFRYQHDGGGDFGVLSGASIMHGDGIVCGSGYISSWGYQREEDDTYTLWGTAYEPVSLGVFGYMPASDDYAEGLSFDEISTDLFGCNGLTL